MLSDFSRILGLDIGTKSIKLAFIEKDIKSFNIKLDEAIIPFEREKLVYQNLSLLLKELIKKNEIPPYTPTIFSIGGESSFVRTVKLPPLSQEKIDKIVQFEVRQQIPVSLADLFWDYVLIKEEGKRLSSLIVASKKSLINERLRNIKEANLKAVAVSCDIISIFNILYQFQTVSSFLIVDIGSHNTNLILYNQKGIYARSLPLGSNTLTLKISQKLNISIEEAEKIKLNPLGRREEIKIIAQEFLEDLNEHINNSIDFYKSQIEKLKIEKIVLAGGGSLLKDTQKYIGKNLNIETIYPEIPIEIKNSIKNKEVFLKFLVAIANAFSVFKKDFFQINLIKHLLSKEKLNRQKNLYLGATALCLTLIFIFGFFFLRNEYHYQKTYLEALKGQISLFENYQPRIQKIQEENFILQKKIKLAQSFSNLKDMWLLALANLSDSKPPELWFTDFKFEIQDLQKKKISLILTGRTYTYSALSSFISNIKEKKIFKNVSPQSTLIIKTKWGGKNIELVEFTLNMEI
jgi:type IV pilus assembly protein PilM